MSFIPASVIALFGGVVVFWLFFVIVGLALTVFWVIEIIDVLRREFNDSTTKVIWLLVVVFLHALGAIIYYFVGRPQGRIPNI